MRIGVIAPPWAPVPPALYGGIELIVDRLATGFQAAGHDVLLFTTGDSTCPVPRQWVLPEAEGERIGVVVPEMRHLIHAYEAVRDCDIVHDHSVAGPLYAGRFPDLRVVTTIHGEFRQVATWPDTTPWRLSSTLRAPLAWDEAAAMSQTQRALRLTREAP